MNRLLDRALELSDYHARQRRFAAENPGRRVKKGIGLATYIEICAFPGSEKAEVQLGDAPLPTEHEVERLLELAVARPGEHEAREHEHHGGAQGRVAVQCVLDALQRAPGGRLQRGSVARRRSDQILTSSACGTPLRNRRMYSSGSEARRASAAGSNRRSVPPSSSSSVPLMRAARRRAASTRQR